MTKNARRGWFEGREPPEAPEEDREAEVEGRLWAAQKKAHDGATHVVESAAQLLASTARQQALLDGITELARQAANRSPEIQEPTGRIVKALDRLRLVALNVGLEGARIGDPTGRALMNVADEVRNLSEGADEALQDLGTALDDIHSTWNQVVRRTDELRDSHASIVAQAGKQQSVAQDIVEQVEAFGRHAQALSDTDPQTAVILGQIAEHAKGLFDGLTSLGGRARRELLRSALGPSLQPLLRALLDVAKSTKGDKNSE
jgi:methyl-accepting chemotaxis protein